ncbi:MAG: FG-GAP-like repeat-containing protein [Acidobacteriota bacterium]
MDVTVSAGFTHLHHKPYLDPKLEPIMPWVNSVGAAAAAGDFDNDGWVDLYVTDSHKGKPNHLYRNQGEGTFADVARQAGVADVNDDSGVSMDCVWGDYDNDGYLDLFVVKWGRDRLFRNDGDGTFTDVTTMAFQNETNEPGSPWANGSAATWVDYDGDGRLDLYVGNYFAPFNLWHLEHTRIMHDDFEKARNGGRNLLFHNNGDGTFTETAARLGLDDPGWTLSVGHGDIDNDGWPDIYSANDFGPDQLFLNRRDGTFRNISDQSLGPDTKKGMNVDFGDFDNDGWLDIYVTNITSAKYLQEGNMLWYNGASDEDGVPIFMDVSVETGTQDGGWGWGAKFFDFDGDGDLDIVALNGFISADEESYWYALGSWIVSGEDVGDAMNWPPIGNRSFSGREATRLWRNEGEQRFTEIGRQAGVDDRRDGRGVALLDYDNDGDLDMYLANEGTAPAFFQNQVGARRHWLGLRLIGRPEAGSNRDAIGARVTLVTAAGRQTRELDGGNSYCGQSDRRIYFGLGDERVIERLEIRWPSRRAQLMTDLRADQLLTLREPAILPEVVSLIPTTREPGATALSRRSALPDVPLSPAEGDALLSRLEEEVRDRLTDLGLGSQYRGQCTQLGRQERSVRFFERLVGEHPTVRNLRLQLAAAYVDEIPTCGGVAAIVCKGRLARRSLDQLDLLIEADESWWPALYARGMNHLYWPRALRHSDLAASDFRKCIEVQTRGGPPDARFYYGRSYVGLGDALAKEGDFSGARKAWQKGWSVFPGNPDLKERLALESLEKARAYVERVRNPEGQMDTDLSFLLSQ